MRKVVIVGGVAGGMSTATRLRRLDSEAEIIVLEKSGHVSYANCGLPYFIGGVIEDKDSLLLQTPKSLYERFRLDVRVRNEVIDIDRTKKELLVQDHLTQESYTITYDTLVLSTGAKPVIPSIEGVELAFTLRNIEDVERMVSALEKKPESAVIIGGGFIGLELAENLVNQGIKVSIVESASQVLAPLDAEMASLVEEELQKNDVKLYLQSNVQSIRIGSVLLENGEVLPSTLTILAIGVRPDVTLAERAGLGVGSKGGLVVNRFNLTTDPNIYAIGDLVEKVDELDDSATLVPLANIANRHGRIVADHIAGREIREVKTIGTAIVKVFDLVIATTGWNEKRLKRSSIDYLSIHSHPNSHAGYYPDAKQMSIKLLFSDKTGEIYGAQAVGSEGVDKRIDVLATAIRGGITAPELADLELAYAPPFGSAKDPVNMLGYMAENVLNGTEKIAHWDQIDEMVYRGYKIVDVRSQNEFETGSLPGAVNIPVDELRTRHPELRTKKVLVTCQVGQRGHTAAMFLNALGYDAFNLDGGYLLWSKSPANGRKERKEIAHV